MFLAQYLSCLYRQTLLSSFSFSNLGKLSLFLKLNLLGDIGLTLALLKPPQLLWKMSGGYSICTHELMKIAFAFTTTLQFVTLCLPCFFSFKLFWSAAVDVSACLCLPGLGCTINYDTEAAVLSHHDLFCPQMQQCQGSVRKTTSCRLSFSKRGQSMWRGRADVVRALIWCALTCGVDTRGMEIAAMLLVEGMLLELQARQSTVWLSPSDNNSCC